MRPIILKGHERSITYLKYNREGDLLFTCSKANFPCVWYAETGERIGTYNGHNGTVWSLDVNYDSTVLITASADMSAKIWDAETGKEFQTIQFKAPARWVEFAEGDRQFLVATDNVMNQQTTIHIFNLNETGKKAIGTTSEIKIEGAKITQASWGPLNKTIIVSFEDGTLRAYDPITKAVVLEKKDHTKTITRFTFNQSRALFITASKDGSAKIYDATTLEMLKNYESGRPMNGSCISPLKEHVIVGGGAAAESITTNKADSSQFKVRFFHKIFQDELGTGVPGHFGPVNTLAFSPDGRSFTSGGEDGFVRIHHLDPSYLDD